MSSLKSPDSSYINLRSKGSSLSINFTHYSISSENLYESREFSIFSKEKEDFYDFYSLAGSP